jgi:Cys-tRNA synthase (O-phospho-L-seryl-tRNA:Cys-tRNA synthase)
MGLDSREKRMIWEIYKEFVLDKMISEGNNTWRKKHLHMRRYPYLNESVDSVEKNKPYLDKVVDKLKHYTTFAASKSHVYRPFYTAQIPFTGGQKWYIEWFSNSLETGYGFKDGFKKEMRDVYGLTPEEIEYVYMKFTSYLIKEFEGRYTKVHVVKDQ